MSLDIEYYNDFSEEKLQTVLQNALFILPTVSYANLDQMVIDIVLYNVATFSDVIKIARLNSPYCLPIIGSSPFCQNDKSTFSLTTALELFYLPQQNVVILQQRSQPIDGMGEKFAQSIMEWVSRLSPSRLIFLSAADCTFFDMKMTKNTIVYYTTSKEVLDHIQNLIASMNLVDDELNGSGLLQVYQKICLEKSILFTSFLSFVNEGNNFKDAVEFFKKINEAYLHIDIKNVVMPPVWYTIDPWLDEDYVLIVCLIIMICCKFGLDKNLLILN